MALHEDGMSKEVGQRLLVLGLIGEVGEFRDGVEVRFPASLLFAVLAR